MNIFELNLEVVIKTEWFANIGRQLTGATKLCTVASNI